MKPNRWLITKFTNATQIQFMCLEVYGTGSKQALNTSTYYYSVTAATNLMENEAIEESLWVYCIPDKKPWS